MNTRDLLLNETGAAARPEEAAALESAGRHVGIVLRAQGGHGATKSEKLPSADKFEDRILASARDWPGPERLWLIENVRLIHAAIKETRGLRRSLRQYPVCTEESGRTVPRAYAAATYFLDAAANDSGEDKIKAFLKGLNQECELQMGEIWALKPTLQYALLERLASALPENWQRIVPGLRQIAETSWKDLFEAVNPVDAVLARDPAGAYLGMDFDSRESYRKVVAELAERSGSTERQVAEAAIHLASDALKWSDETRAKQRRTHVGFYLLDQGLSRLRHAVDYRTPWMRRFRDAIVANPNAFYLVGIELMTFLIVASLLEQLDTLTPILAGFFLLLLPATQAACDFINNLTSFFVPPRALPKLDFSKGIPAEHATMIAVPTLLLNEDQVRELALDLEIRYLANRDPNLVFALVTDSPDSDRPVDDRDPLVGSCQERIEALNRRYGREGNGPFYMFHRYRVFNESEGRWMGWERKRGKLLDLNQLMRGGFDSFPVKVGDLSALPRIRYVLTLDSDTQLPRDSAAKMIGAIAHPLNQAVVDRATNMVVEGYGILQPRIGISIQSASRSRLASIYSGQTGFDIYTRAISDVYQDLFGEGIFTGKGIYDVDVLRQVLERRFPDNALLSHDLIEGAYARAALASDIELIDDYPSHFSAYSRRKHRWVRGDWQILRWLLPVVPDRHGNLVANPIALISRWKILDNLRRSLFEPATLLLLVAGWLYLPGKPLFWTLASVAMLLMPAYSNLLFSLLRAPWMSWRSLRVWAASTAEAFVNGHVVALLAIVFLLHQALLSLDAIARSILRVFITGKKLLEWETAAEAESAVRRKSTVDKYLEWTPWMALAAAAVVWRIRPEALPVAAPILTLWFLSRGISGWLNRAPRTPHRELSLADRKLLQDTAQRICAFFRDWSTAGTNWLIPDNLRDDGTAAMRLSPTNVGFLLNARVVAVHLEALRLSEFVDQTRKTLDSVLALPKYRGHLLNWYDPQTLEPLAPRFVSSVDSGNLAACLWTLKQAALKFASEPADQRGMTVEHASQLLDIANTCEALVQQMDFRFLYNRKKKVLSVGYSLDSERLEASTYDLLASESRIASFVAIAKGDIPQESWFHLGRRHTLSGRERVLVSWTGTMFEYLMPALWMRHHRDTITQQSMEAAVRVQREYVKRKGIPWGISESGCTSGGTCDYGYSAFGVPDLSMKQMAGDSVVVSPYSSFLALAIDPRCALDNIHRMADLGWTGRYGFYEAVDYSVENGEVIRSWMAHHQGMTLLAIANLLCDNQMQRYFHSEPHVLATELLLHERVPASALVEVEPEAPFSTALAAGAMP